MGWAGGWAPVGLKGLGAEGGWVSEMGGAVLNLGRRFVELTLP